MRMKIVPFRIGLRSAAVVLLTELAACSAHRGGTVPKVPVSVARVERRSVPYELDANGTVEPIRSVDVLPQVNGTILHVHFAEGDEVAAGQVLFEIDPRQYSAALQQAEGKLLGDLTTATSAAREAARYRELATTNTVTQEDYEQKQAAADAAAAAARSDSATAGVTQPNHQLATMPAPHCKRTSRH